MAALNIGIGLGLIAVVFVVAYVVVRLARPLRTASWVDATWRRGGVGLGWLTARVAPSILILVLGSLAVLGLAFVFAEILDGVVDQDDLTVIDRPVLYWLNSHRSATLTTFVNAVTNLGGVAFLAPAITAVAAAVAWRLRSWRPIWITAVTVGGIQLLVFTIKVLIARPRPAPAIVDVIAGGFSFPSGHTASSLVGYGMIAWLICMVTRRGSIRAAVWLSAVLLTLAIGLSRVYLSVHFPTDVIGGWMLGITWLVFVAVAVGLARSRLSGALRCRTQNRGDLRSSA